MNIQTRALKTNGRRKLYKLEYEGLTHERAIIRAQNLRTRGYQVRVLRLGDAWATWVR